jgi:uncharacterized protein YrrD
MLHKALDQLCRDEVRATDGRVGPIQDIFFDDERWAVRYFVVDTSEWLPGRQVLLSPASVARNQMTEREIPVNLTREQVRNAPGTEADKPVSRLFEQAHADYYGYPYYWEGLSLWGSVPFPVSSAPRQRARGVEAAQVLEAAEAAARESHLRSGVEVSGYRIHAVDGEIGHIEDFLVDDSDWSIGALVVETRNWLPGKEVRIPASAVESIDWSARTINVQLRREEVKTAPRSS